eukprot:1474713-Prymnesium_polylepis.2
MRERGKGGGAGRGAQGEERAKGRPKGYTSPLRSYTPPYTPPLPPIHLPTLPPCLLHASLRSPPCLLSASASYPPPYTPPLPPTRLPRITCARRAFISSATPERDESAACSSLRSWVSCSPCSCARACAIRPSSDRQTITLVRPPPDHRQTIIRLARVRARTPALSASDAPGPPRAPRPN